MNRQFETKFVSTPTYQLNGMYPAGNYHYQPQPTSVPQYGSTVRCDPSVQNLQQLPNNNISFQDVSFSSTAGYSLPAAENLISHAPTYQLSPPVPQYQVYSQDNSYILSSQISSSSSDCGHSPGRNDEQLVGPTNVDFIDQSGALSLDSSLISQVLANENINIKLGNKQFSRNELIQLINLSEKSDNKLAIQALIKKLLANNLQNKNMHVATRPVDKQSAINAENYALSLITPPLSPSDDKFQFPSKVPLFEKPKLSPITSKPIFFSSNKSTEIVMPSNNTCSTSVKIEPENLPEQNLIKSEEESTAYSMNNQISYDIDIGNDGQTIAANYGCEQVLMGDNHSVDFGSTPMSPMESGIVPDLTVSSREAYQVSIKVPPKNGGKHGGKHSSLSKTRKQKNQRCVDSDLQFLGQQSTQKQTQKQSQKRSAHLSAEFRYRTKLNDKISKLRILVGQKVHLSKSAVLTRSIETIVKLQKHIMQLSDENARLKGTIGNITHQNNKSESGSAIANSLEYNPSTKKLMPLKELKALAKSTRPPKDLHQMPQHSAEASFDSNFGKSVFEKSMQDITDNNNVCPSAGIVVDSSNQDLDLDKFFDQF